MKARGIILMASGIFSKNEIRKRHRQKHKKNGLCIHCSKNAIEGQVLCEFHREKNKKAQEESRNKYHTHKHRQLT